MKKDISKAKFIIYFVEFLLNFYYMTLLVGFPESSGGRIRSFPVDIIPPLFSMLIYQQYMNNGLVGGYRDVVSPHIHAHHHRQITY
jgi:tryptophan-rich sensory protein